MINRGSLLKPLKSGGVFSGIARAFRLLNSKERRHAALLVASMQVNAVLGLIGLAGVLPFIHLMLEPAPLEGGGRFAKIFASLGFTDTDTALTVFGLSLTGVIILKNVYSFFHSGRQAQFCAGVEARMASQLLARIADAPYGWIVTQNSSVLRDIVLYRTIEWSRGAIRGALQIANDVIFLLFAVALILYESPIVGLVVTVIAAVCISALSALVRPKIETFSERRRAAHRSASVTAGEVISGGREVRIFGAGEILSRSFRKDIASYANADSGNRQWQTIPRLGMEIIGFAALVAVALGALYAGAPRVEVASLIALYALVAVRAIPVIGQISTSFAGLLGSLPSALEISRLSEDLPPQESKAIPADKIADWRCLRLDDVVFSYRGRREQVLGSVSLTIERNRSYGIVGASGSGKSTLVDIIAGLLEPTSGRVLLDDTEITPQSVASWRSRIAYVPQDPFLIDATLADNIAFGEGVVTASAGDKLQAAVAAARLSDVVLQLPAGLNCRLGERGVRLSGGQRQRVAIARALYREADCLILDEATSALDAITEREVAEAIRSLRSRLTIVCIAHRLSTVVWCDELLVLDKGVIVAKGSHANLIDHNEAYQRLFEAQQR